MQLLCTDGVGNSGFMRINQRLRFCDDDFGGGIFQLELSLDLDRNGRVNINESAEWLKPE